MEKLIFTYFFTEEFEYFTYFTEVYLPFEYESLDKAKKILLEVLENNSNGFNKAKSFCGINVIYDMGVKIERIEDWFNKNRKVI